MDLDRDVLQFRFDIQLKPKFVSIGTRAGRRHPSVEGSPEIDLHATGHTTTL